MIAAKAVKSKPRSHVLICDDVGMIRQAVRALLEDTHDFE